MCLGAVEQLHEEQEHSMKIDALRKSLEEQVKQLQVQISKLFEVIWHGARIYRSTLRPGSSAISH